MAPYASMDPDLIPLVIASAAVACQFQAHRNLAPPWRGRLWRVTWSLPRREYFTRTGWRYQVAALALGAIAVLSLVVVGAANGTP